MAFRLVSMPEDGGAVEPQPKRYRLVSSAEEQIVNNAGKNDRELSTGEILSDVASSAGRGLKNAVTGTLGMVGDVASLTGKSAAGYAGMFGASPEQAQTVEEGARRTVGAMFSPVAAVIPAMQPPTSSQLNQVVADYVGPDAEPRTGYGDAAQSIAEFSGGAIGPGGLVRKTAQTVIPGLASSLAGQATKGTAAEPYARLAGALAGGVATAGKGLTQATQRITNEQLVQQAQAAKTAAYNAAEQAGVRYTPEAFNDLVDNIASSLTKANINPLRHEKAVSVFQDIDSMRGQAPSLTQLDQLKQVIARDLLNTQDGALQEFGRKMRNRIDDFIDNADATMVSSGDPEQAAQLIRQAREANKRYRNLETVSNAVTKAERRAESTGSGGNADNALRQNIRGILDSPRKSKFFSKEEQRLMDEAIRDTGAQKAVRLTGKLSPQGSGLMAALSIGGAMANPALAVPALVGAVAKPLAERMTRKKIDALIEALAGRPIRRTNENRRDAIARLLLSAEGASLPIRE